MSTFIKGSKEQSIRPFGLRDKVSYMLGDFGCNCSFALIQTYFMVFYVTVMGIDLIHYGIIILLTKVWDGINDPIIGMITDSVKVKDGQDKFKPWIKYTALPMTLVTAVMFLYIPSMPYFVKVLQCIVTYILWDTCYTCINVPYGSLQTVITQDPVERAELSRFRSIGAFLAHIPLGIIIPMVVYVDKKPSGERFTIMAIVLGIISFVAFMLLYRNTTERVKVKVVTDEKFNYIKTFVSFLKNRPMVAVTIASMASFVLTASSSVMNQYVFMTYYKKPELLSIGMLVSFIPTIFAMIFVKVFVTKFGKKALCSWPFLLAAVCYGIQLIFPINNPYMWFILQGIAGLFTGFNTMLVWSLVADCIDYQEYQTGRREEGSIYATYSLFRKLAQGFGATIVAFLLALTGYNKDLATVEQLPGVAQNIKILAAVLPFIGVIISFFVMYFLYNLTDSKVIEIQGNLASNQKESA